MVSSARGDIIAMREISLLADYMYELMAVDAARNQLLFLATVPDYKSNNQVSHVVNVAIISAAIAYKIGVSPLIARDLIVSAYLHDIGIPAGGFEDIESELISHNIKGFEILSRMTKFEMERIYASVAAVSHHSKSVDGITTGSSFSIQTSFFEDLIQIADFYDLATRFWPRKGRAYFSRPNALRKIFEYAGQGVFSAETAEALASAVGIIPSGSIYKFCGKDEIAVVANPVFSKEKNVAVFVVDSEFIFKEKKEITLAELDELKDQFVYKLPPALLSTILNTFFDQ